MNGDYIDTRVHITVPEWHEKADITSSAGHTVTTMYYLLRKHPGAPTNRTAAPV